METYKVVRFFFESRRNITIKRGLTLEEAKEHCSDPETSSSTCTKAAGKRRTRLYGPWFDGYTMETYKVFRVFFKSCRNITIKRGLTLEEAKEHCSDPETSSSTCTKAAGKRRTRLYGPWFDGHTKE